MQGQLAAEPRAWRDVAGNGLLYDIRPWVLANQEHGSDFAALELRDLASFKMLRRTGRQRIGPMRDNSGARDQPCPAF
jgi:hypothetical protein